MDTFTFFWRDGKRDVFQGDSRSDALNRAGYGAGALRALDFVAEGDDKGYWYDAQLKTWRKS